MLKAFPKLFTGFLCGFSVVLLFRWQTGPWPSFHKSWISTSQSNVVSTFYETNLADELIKSVRILCFVNTIPINHRTRAVFIKETWGKRCDKLLFVTTEEDSELETLVLDVQNTRKALRNRTRETLLHAHREHLMEFDWFMKADDDTYIIMENLRYLLHQYQTDTAFLFGDRFVKNKTGHEEGYMAGGAYILSRKALVKFAEQISMAPKKDPFFRNGEAEDLHLGRILSHKAIFVDTRDDLKRKRFFPIQIENHLEPARPEFWYTKFLYYGVATGLDCCSDVPIVFHYTKNQTMFLMEYFFYHSQVFGLSKNLTEVLPRKLSLDEIIEASDMKSSSINFRNHTDYHNISSSEIF